MAWKVPIDFNNFNFPRAGKVAAFEEWTEDADEAAAREADSAADVYFTEDEIASWTGKQAILWILEAGNAFEVLGLRPKRAPAERLRRRFKRLSLLTHPDKNPLDDASAAFRKLSESMRALAGGQEELLNCLFPKHSEGGYAAQDGYEASRSQERALNRELQAQLDRALREEKAGREAQQADEAHAEWAKRRRSLEELLQARKQKTLGLPPDQFAPAKRPKTEARVAAPQGWRLPEHCQPNPDRSSGASADPQTLWRLAGQQGLACNGWRRLESRRLPGRFYFLHETGRKEMEEGTLTEALEEPKGWQRRASRSRPGFFYFVNLATGEKRPDVSLPKERPVSDQGARAARSPPKERECERQAWPWDAVPSLAEVRAAKMAAD